MIWNRLDSITSPLVKITKQLFVFKRPAMFCLYTSSKVSCPQFEFSMKASLIRLNLGYLLKSSQIYTKNFISFSKKYLVCWAPAIEPKTAAFCLSFLIPFPAKKAPPPLENWIITGDWISLAAWRAALIVDVEVQLNAGKAIWNPKNSIIQKM